MQQLTQPVTAGFVATTGEGVDFYRAVCPLPKRLQYLYSRRLVKPVHVQLPGDSRLHCMPIEVDGTSRHDAPYVHSTLGKTSSPDQLARCWQPGDSQDSATLYAAAQERDFDQQLCDASKGVFQNNGGSDRETLFFLCADGKAQIYMANCVT